MVTMVLGIVNIVDTYIYIYIFTEVVSILEIMINLKYIIYGHYQYNKYTIRFICTPLIRNCIAYDYYKSL